ncbi:MULTISPECIES: alpha,alpha-phosphotrehalase [Bacillus]|uniref:Alpha,alpha-phosphotrehalase n=1 Tax=Bacillus glycinifermentans TaxID=1664069 RepID=A0AAJ3YVT1_9BACI|nr:MULTISPECIES: alpha,alpha-phosphotrehalase [Bacillus]KKB74088.1 trehalose-6-phosphate hydrolase [Bacillus sp. TH008]MBU8786695.1 alpha,alpha-phosphotrehalase [Bacillus glycinifermentans]MDU0070427.1 alpha,alpha-phosphotrehalase [Bacillus sp. IG6]MED8018290.1 alpha,alpha-phosphotrehalase [Bacillus glycinifermentans]NUJ16611.1 alpha,alpha-phosphotrehalase [Bacillus glycinifermentans]
METKQQPWWKTAVVYQIYPKSFNDTTGSGVGDIQGIIEKLDYIKELSCDVIWLTPIYESPQRDNGYDISDYYRIHEDYGTMEDFERLLEEAHKRGLKVIMDLVVNHTSTEHRWFKEASSAKDNPYRNFYIWKDGKPDGSEPTNWESKFGGSAWAFDEKTGQYYLHLYDVTQADLNWENEEVRKKVYEMMHFWFEKGIDGFRLDVINVISKDQRFPDDDQGDGRRFYTDGPRVHEFLHEMNREVFSQYDSMTVGEMSSTSIADCIKYTNPDSQELNMVFNFHHLKVDYPNGEKWSLSEFDFLKLKKILSEWQTEMNKGGGWNALFWCNHDQPRIVSRYGDDGKHRKKSAKMLATAIHMLQGTPYIYQGEEIGMTNPKFDDISQYRDVESINMYCLMKEEGKPEQEIIGILKAKSRDNSRTPMQWNGGENAGFTTGTPWIPIPANYKDINAEEALQDPDSVFYHYKKLNELRKEYEIITTGDFQLILEGDPQLFAYIRNGKNEKLLVINNFYGKETEFRLPETIDCEGYSAEVLITNDPEIPEQFGRFTVKPYQSIVYHLAKPC